MKPENSNAKIIIEAINGFGNIFKSEV